MGTTEALLTPSAGQAQNWTCFARKHAGIGRRRHREGGQGAT